MTERPTLKTIAFATGLAVTTVSRALKDAPDIGQETKRRVRLVAEQIGYRPNRAGVRLRTGKTNVIALILDVDDKIMSVTPHLVHGISEIVSTQPYHMVLMPFSRTSDPMEPVRYVVETGAADGVIFSRTQRDDPRVRYLVQHGMPFATHGRTDMGIEHAYHDFENETFAREGVQRLSRRGRRRFALLAPPSALAYSRHMVGGFLEGIDDVGGTEVPFSGVDVDSSFEEIKARTEQIMSGDNRPDGIVCGSGASTLGLIAGIEAAGAEVGRDIDLATKQFINVLHWIRAPLDVSTEDARHGGRELARAVFAQIDGADPATLQSLSRPVWIDPPTSG